MIKDLTIVIQGRTTEEALNFMASKYDSYCKIIISTWSDQDISIKLPTNFKILKFPKPADPGNQNINLQICSTLNGLYLVDTKYCIKMRGDEYISNIDYIYNNIKQNENILYTLPIWFRSCNIDATTSIYHISDHLIAGTYLNLMKMFRCAVQGFKDKLVAEQILCINYIIYKNLEGKNINDYIKFCEWESLSSNSTEVIKKIMIEHFDILDLEKLKPYLLVANCIGKKFYSNFIPKQQASISKIQDI